MLYFELAIVIVLIVINGLLSMSELAIVSSRPARLAGLVEKRQRRPPRARACLRSRKIPVHGADRHHAGRRAVGRFFRRHARAAAGAWLIELGMSQSVADTVGVGVVVGFITYASLIVGELVPKQIALRDPESVAVKVAPAMTVLAKVSPPLVWLLDFSGKGLLWLLGHRGQAEEQGHRRGDQDAGGGSRARRRDGARRKEMIAGVMRLGDLPVGAVMTPRNEVSMIDLADPPARDFRHPEEKRPLPRGRVRRRT